jgi:TM2 domain-containing membrane protein YozV
MKYRSFGFLVFFAMTGALQAAPNFWDVPNATPTPVPAPEIQNWGQITEYNTPVPTPTAVMAPKFEYLSPTPTPQPGLSPKDPTVAALFSVVVPGAGHVYAGDPLKGIIFASLFGVGLWQTLDNLQLVRTSAGDLVAKDETAGNLFGLATLAAYGFGIQDAMNTATDYNKQNHLTVSLGLEPFPTATLAYRF